MNEEKEKPVSFMMILPIQIIYIIIFIIHLPPTTARNNRNRKFTRSQFANYVISVYIRAFELLFANNNITLDVCIIFLYTFMV